MGMFDDIAYNGEACQTKDLECCLSQYKIEGGRLLKLHYELEDIPEEELTPNEFGFVPRRRVKKGTEKWEDQNYHGWLNFYGEKEYDAKFTDGQIVEIKERKEEA